MYKMEIQLNKHQSTNASPHPEKSSREPLRGDKGLFKSSLDISNINPYELLQLLMKIRGYSYSKLGTELGGYGKCYICDIFHGKKIPKKELQKKIANLFGLPIGFIWGL